MAPALNPQGLTHQARRHWLQEPDGPRCAHCIPLGFLHPHDGQETYCVDWLVPIQQEGSSLRQQPTQQRSMLRDAVVEPPSPPKKRQSAWQTLTQMSKRVGQELSAEHQATERLGHPLHKTQFKFLGFVCRKGLALCFSLSHHLGKCSHCGFVIEEDRFNLTLTDFLNNDMIHGLNGGGSRRIGQRRDLTENGSSLQLSHFNKPFVTGWIGNQH